MRDFLARIAILLILMAVFFQNVTLYGLSLQVYIFLLGFVLLIAAVGRVQLSLGDILFFLILSSVLFSLLFRYIYNISTFELFKSYILVFVNLFLLAGLKEIPTKLYSFTWSAYKVLVFLNLIVVLAQFAGIFIGYSFTLPWQVTGFQNFDMHRSRPSGLFSEPAHLALAAIPILVVGDRLSKLEGILFTLYSLSLFLTFSSTDYVFATLVLLRLIAMMFLSRKGNSFSTLSRILGIITLLFLVLLVFSFLPRLPQFQRIQASLSLSDMSSQARLLEGFRIFSELDITHKLFGVGPGDLKPALEKLLSININEYLIPSGGLSVELISYGIMFVILEKVFLTMKLGLKNFLVILIYQLGAGLTINSPGMIYIVLLFMTAQYVTSPKEKHSQLATQSTQSLMVH